MPRGKITTYKPGSYRPPKQHGMKAAEVERQRYLQHHERTKFVKPAIFFGLSIMYFFVVFLLVIKPSQTHAHFSLTSPSPNGIFNSETAGAFPCGGAFVDSRLNVIDWPTAGLPVGFITSHGPASWSFRAALLNDTSNSGWRFVQPVVHQSSGQGHCCLPSVPGIHDWIGHDGVVQIAQRSADGIALQCVAARFTAMPAAPLPDNPELCKNYTARGAIVLTVEPEMPVDNKIPLPKIGQSNTTFFVAGTFFAWLIPSLWYIYKYA